MLQRLRALKDRLEFAVLFRWLAGTDIGAAAVNVSGWLYIPKKSGFGEKPRWARRRLGVLAGPDGWTNNLTDDEYDGWWVRQPS